MQLEGLQHLVFSVEIVLKNLSVNFEVSGWAQKPAQKRMTYRGEETSTAETLAVEHLLPRVLPEGVAAILGVPDVQYINRAPHVLMHSRCTDLFHLLSACTVSHSPPCTCMAQD